MADTIPELTLKSSVVGDESIPADNGVQTYRITPSQMYDYMRTRFIFGAGEISNLAIATAVGSNELTISLKTKANADASSSDPIRVAFRSATLTSGLYNSRTITGSISLVISSGSTLGQVSGQPSRIWVYLIDNAGTLELAVSHSWYPDDALVSTTAEGGAGAADSATTIYSASSRSNVPIRLIGYIDNTQATAGTWASAGSQIQVLSDRGVKAPTVQTFSSGSGTYYTPAGCKALRVRIIGGGGGGRGTNGAGAGDGTAGGNTTFGSLQANGGSAGMLANSPPGQATASGGDINLPGGYGCVTVAGEGGLGGGTVLAPPTSGANGQGNAGIGPGAGGSSGAYNGSAATGGGGGAYCEKWIVNPAASYSYGVGAGGNQGGGAVWPGGAGFAGIVIVEEFY